MRRLRATQFAPTVRGSDVLDRDFVLLTIFAVHIAARASRMKLREINRQPRQLANAENDLRCVRVSVAFVSAILAQQRGDGLFLASLMLLEARAVGSLRFVEIADIRHKAVERPGLV